MKYLFLFLFSLLHMAGMDAQGKVVIPNPENFPEPVALDYTSCEQLGTMIHRTMYLLESSKPGYRRKVKIAIYGQSLSDENNYWWRDLYAALKCAYSNADIEVRCLGVGGFATATLWRTAYADMAAYYPDLVILCVSGHHTYYETILRFIRGCTTAEMLVQTDVIGGKTGEGEGCAWKADLNDMNDWSNRTSFRALPEFCQRYHLELENRKQEWYDYLKANCYSPMSGQLLQADGGHLAAQGQYLTASLAARHFRYTPDASPDPYGTVTVYRPGTDVEISGNTLTIPVNGNRIDVIVANGKGGREKLELLVDGKKPSSFPGCYKNSRAIVYDSFWNGGIAQTFGTSVDLQEEEWRIDMDSDGHFTLNGSKTGFDGYGTIAQRFESNSGRIVIRAEDWFKGSTELKDRSFIFQTKLFAHDEFLLPSHQSVLEENIITLAQGLPNGKHEITLTGAVERIKEIHVRKPPFQLTLNVDHSVLNFAKEGGKAGITISSNTYWQVYNRTSWLQIDALDNNHGEGLSDNLTLTVTATPNDTGKPRTASFLLVGIGVAPLTITVSQLPSN